MRSWWTLIDKLKSITRGYGSMDYEHAGYREDELVRMDILIASEPVDAFSCIVHRGKAESRGRAALREVEGGHPAAALRRGHSSGHRRQNHRPRIHQRPQQERDRQVLRRRHLPQAQAAGEAEGRKKKMKAFGRVNIPQEAFIEVLKSD